MKETANNSTIFYVQGGINLSTIVRSYQKSKLTFIIVINVYTNFISICASSTKKKYGNSE